MKRSPLRRSAPLKSGSSMKPGSGLKSSTGLKRTKGLSSESTLGAGSGLTSSQGLKQAGSLSSSTGLSSSATLKRGDQGLRSKPRAPMSEAEREMALAWILAVRARNAGHRRSGDRCRGCGLHSSRDGRPVTLEGHHVIAQQHIDRIASDLGIDAMSLRWDVDLGVMLCAGLDSNRCHENHTSSHTKLAVSKLPYWTVERIQELELDWYLDQYYA